MVIKMGDKMSIFLVVILAIVCLMMVSALLACYACLFRDLFCRSESRWKRRRRASSRRELGNPNRVAIPLNDIAQGDSVLTESEKITQGDSVPTESEKIAQEDCVPIEPEKIAQGESIPTESEKV